MRLPGHTFWIILFQTLLLISCTQPDLPTINLYRAIHAGDLDQIKRHLYHGTDINQPDREGQMPLHVAAERGRLVITRQLVDHGAQLDARNSRGHTPLEVAVLAGKTQLARLLLERGAAMDTQALLIETIRVNTNFRDVFDFLVKHGADVNAPKSSGDTPLIVAVREGHRLLVKRLINEGADVNLRTAQELTPLGVAKETGNQDIIRLLKSYGAN